MPSDSLPDNREIWRIAAPMILSNVSVPLLGMVDTGVTGHLEDAVYLGAVAVGSTIFGFLYAGFNFLRMGTTGITAQRFGASDGEGLKGAGSGNKGKGTCAAGSLSSSTSTSRTKKERR